MHSISDSIGQQKYSATDDKLLYFMMWEWHSNTDAKIFTQKEQRTENKNRWLRSMHRSHLRKRKELSVTSRIHSVHREGFPGNCKQEIYIRLPFSLCCRRWQLVWWSVCHRDRKAYRTSTLPSRRQRRTAWCLRVSTHHCWTDRVHWITPQITCKHLMRPILTMSDDDNKSKIICGFNFLQLTKLLS